MGKKSRKQILKFHFYLGSNASRRFVKQERSKSFGQIADGKSHLSTFGTKYFRSLIFVGGLGTTFGGGKGGKQVWVQVQQGMGAGPTRTQQGAMPQGAMQQEARKLPIQCQQQSGEGRHQGKGQATTRNTAGQERIPALGQDEGSLCALRGEANSGLFAFF